MHATCRALAISSTLFFSSCLSTPVDTASGRPEVTIAGVDREAVQNELVVDFSYQGFSVVDQNQYSLTFLKAAEGAAKFWYGSAGSPQPEWMVRCTTVQRNADVLVTASCQIREVDVSRNTTPAAQVQEILTRVRDRMSPQPDPEAASEGLDSPSMRG